MRHVLQLRVTFYDELWRSDTSHLNFFGFRWFSVFGRWFWLGFGLVSLHSPQTKTMVSSSCSLTLSSKQSLSCSQELLTSEREASVVTSSSWLWLLSQHTTHWHSTTKRWLSCTRAMLFISMHPFSSKALFCSTCLLVHPSRLQQKACFGGLAQPKSWQLHSNRVHT